MRALALALLPLLPACLTSTPPPQFHGLELREARKEVRRQSSGVSDLSAAVTLVIETGEFDGSLDGALVLKPPSHLRVRTSRLFRDVFDLLITPDEVSLYVYGENLLFHAGAGEEPGAVDPEASDIAQFWGHLDGRVLRLALSRFELPSAAGEDPLRVPDQVVAERFERRGERFYVMSQLESGEHLERIFDGGTLFLEEVIIRRQGEVTQRVYYGNYQEYQGFWIPTRMGLQDLVRGSRFSVLLEDLAVNEGVQPGAFVLDVPPGAKQRP